jgi:hypothetical protein
MDSNYQRFLAAGDADRVVEALSRQQFLRPHQSVNAAIAAVVDELGVCPDAAREAVESLDTNPTSAIGRLRRTELIQLGRTIYRFWRQSVVENSTPSQPA